MQADTKGEKKIQAIISIIKFIKFLKNRYKIICLKVAKPKGKSSLAKKYKQGQTSE